MEDRLGTVVQDVLSQLGSGRIREVFARSIPGGMSEEYFREVLRDYAVTPVSPPPGADLAVRAYEVSTASTPTWAVDVPIWTREEGRSDLTLQLRIELDESDARIMVESLRVL